MQQRNKITKMAIYKKKEGELMKNNIRIRKVLKEAGMKQWQLAELLAISEYTLSRWLRKELPQDEQDRIINIIRKEMK